MRVLMLSTDLVFSSQVRAAAEAHGAAFQMVLRPEALLHQHGQSPAQWVVLDLSASFEVGPLMSQLAGGVETSRPKVTAYGPHVHVGRLEQARSAGCSQVLTKGQFHAALPQMAAQMLAPSA